MLRPGGKQQFETFRYGHKVVGPAGEPCCGLGADPELEKRSEGAHPCPAVQVEMKVQGRLRRQEEREENSADARPVGQALHPCDN